MKNISILCGLIFFASALTATRAQAWGGRGHHTICDAASYLVKEKGLRDYLTSRPQMMGHLCNVPDFYWKSLGGEFNKLGNSAHFIDPEITGLKIQEIPVDYKELIKKFQGQPNKLNEGATIFSIPTEFGSLWWRANQFFSRATALGPAWRKAALPKGYKEEQDDSLPYNKSAYEFVVNLGLMGHFVGDAAQPFHATADYDGYYSGHGGIHAYYEDAGVAAQKYDLMSKVVEAAQKVPTDSTFLKAKTVILKMKALSTLSVEEVPAIYAIDPVKKASTFKKEKGMDLKTEAERPPAETVAAKFEPLIVAQMSRAALLLATLWDEAYKKIGEPKLAAFKSYKYPFTPDFIPPDYYDIPALNHSK